MHTTYDKKNGATRCRFCTSFNKTTLKCVIKDSRVHANKKRRCAHYALDEAKVTVPKTPHTTRGVIDSQYRRKLIKEYKAQSKAEAYPLIETAPPVMPAQFPLTGDLSRFKTTGTVGGSEE